MPRSVPALPWAVDTYRIYDGTDDNWFVGTLPRGYSLRKAGCWRTIFENPVDHGKHCMVPVEWARRWVFLDGWTKVWSCEQHTGEMVAAQPV